MECALHRDWGGVGADTPKASLLTDMHAANHPRRISKAEYRDGFVNPALERLRLYSPTHIPPLRAMTRRRKKSLRDRRPVVRPRSSCLVVVFVNPLAERFDGRQQRLQRALQFRAPASSQLTHGDAFPFPARFGYAARTLLS